jgi:hypothetical protein
MEKLLADMVLLSEIADLAVEAASISDTYNQIDDSKAKKILADAVPKGDKKGSLGWNRPAVTFERNESDGTEHLARDDDLTGDDTTTSNNVLSSGAAIESQLPRSPTTDGVLLGDLDRWEEPVSKVDKVRRMAC